MGPFIGYKVLKARAGDLEAKLLEATATREWEPITMTALASDTVLVIMGRRA